MIHEMRSTAIAGGASQSPRDLLQQQAADLVSASRSVLGGIDTRILAANLVGAAGPRPAAIDALSQAVSAHLTPVEQGSFSNFLEELLETIRTVLGEILGTASAEATPTPMPAPAQLPARAPNSASIPSLEAIAADPAVSGAIAASWQASNPNTPGAKQETGFWVVRDNRSGQLSTVAFPSNGTRDSLTPGPMPRLPGKTTVAFFHTHPNTAAEGYTSGPSTADLNFARANGIPGLIRSHDGMYYFNPPR